MKQLIERTLGNKFNLDEFLLFIKDLFKKDDIKPEKIKIENRFSEYIKDFSFLGDYTDQENKNIEILAVELIGDTKVARARSFQRELIAKYLKDNAIQLVIVAETLSTLLEAESREELIIVNKPDIFKEI